MRRYDISISKTIQLKKEIPIKIKCYPKAQDIKMTLGSGCERKSCEKDTIMSLCTWQLVWENLSEFLITCYKRWLELIFKSNQYKKLRNTGELCSFLNIATRTACRFRFLTKSICLQHISTINTKILNIYLILQIYYFRLQAPMLLKVLPKNNNKNPDPTLTKIYHCKIIKKTKKNFNIPEEMIFLTCSRAFFI